MARRTVIDDIAEGIAVLASTGVRWGWQPIRRSKTAVAAIFVVAYMAAKFLYGSAGVVVVLLLLVAYLIGRPLVARSVWVKRRRVLLAKASLPAPPMREMLRTRRAEARTMRELRAAWTGLCSAHSWVVKGTKKPVPLGRINPTVESDMVAWIDPKGLVDVRTYVENRDLIQQAIGCKEVLVNRVGSSGAEIRFLWTEHFERVIPVAELPMPKGQNQVVYGLRRDGEPAAFSAVNHILIAGMTGGGKSGITWSALTSLSMQKVRHSIWVSDAKGGVEMRQLADKLGQTNGYLTVAGYVPDWQQTIDLIEQFEAAMKARAAETSSRLWTFKDAEQYPMNILIFDESVEVMRKLQQQDSRSDAGKRAKAALGKLETIASQGRALGFFCWFLSQLAQKAVLDTIRDMTPQQLSLKQKNRINTDMVLGDGAEANGAACSEIGNRPGFGYSADDRYRGFQQFRACYCDDADVERIARGELPEGVSSKGAKGVGIRACGVYRLFNEEVESLYIGIAFDVAARFKQHAADKPWWPEVDMSKTKITWANSEAEARAVEEREIRSMLPRYNDQHNRANPLRVDWRHPSFQPQTLQRRPSRKPAKPAERNRLEEALVAGMTEPVENVTPINSRRQQSPAPTNRRKAV